MTRVLALAWPELRVPEPEPQPWEPMLDALDDLSPRVEAVDLGVALVDIAGLEPTWGSERRIAARAVMLTRAVAPLRVRCGIGENRWLATLAARLARFERSGAPAALRILERDGLRDLPLDLLPTDVADAAIRQRFVRFGLTRVGQLADLPRSAVGAQFGPAGERLQALARGHDPRPLVPRRRPERIEALEAFEPPIESIGAVGLTLRRLAADLCDRLRARHLAPGRALLTLRLEDAPALGVAQAFPQPALEPDWIARLLLTRLEATARRRGTTDEPRIASVRLTFDRLADPAATQLPAFEVQAGRWEELRWSLERIRHRFGDGRLWQAGVERPTAALPEHRYRLSELNE